VSARRVGGGQLPGARGQRGGTVRRCVARGQVSCAQQPSGRRLPASSLPVLRHCAPPATLQQGCSRAGPAPVPGSTASSSVASLTKGHIGTRTDGGYTGVACPQLYANAKTPSLRPAHIVRAWPHHPTLLCSLNILHRPRQTTLSTDDSVLETEQRGPALTQIASPLFPGTDERMACIHSLSNTIQLPSSRTHTGG
jgi:hypothetical protein